MSNVHKQRTNGKQLMTNNQHQYQQPTPTSTTNDQQIMTINRCSRISISTQNLKGKDNIDKLKAHIIQTDLSTVELQQAKNIYFYNIEIEYIHLHCNLVKHHLFILNYPCCTIWPCASPGLPVLLDLLVPPAPQHLLLNFPQEKLDQVKQDLYSTQDGETWKIYNFNSYG